MRCTVEPSEGPGHRRGRLHRVAHRGPPAGGRARRARARQLRHRAPREPARRARRDRAGRGRHPELRARPQRRGGLRGRAPPGRAAVGAALRPGPAHEQRHQRHRHAERAAGGARRRGAARGLRLLVLDLRRQPGAAEARGPPAAADLPVRRGQARRRGLLPQLPRGLRPRDGGAPLLQRLRPAAGPALAVRGGGAELHQRAAERRAAPWSTGTASSRATSPTSATWSRATCSR